ncbi:Zn-dependent alcohol dehydrogenase [Microbacterium gorillae]|uniref:Zn-dependent alcohol dehydrogenase n=1 Tax=Microbacterium gorillae TaxID=1231063 RepID=UPI00058EBAFD|nr:Zn-dependent alcohol dehydrogenase [Microbacterium gorillae]
MRAAVFRGAGEPLAVEEVVVADPIGQEVRVRTVAAAVCHSDLHYFRGVLPVQTPMILGHESAGVVTAVGPDVTGVRVGDHVVTCNSVFCGQCRSCVSGTPARCTAKPRFRSADEAPRFSDADGEINSLAGIGGFAEEMVVHEHAVAVIDPAMPMRTAALLGCSVVTGFGAVFHTSPVRPGQDVAVIGCGGVGLNVVQAARFAGARRIIAVDRVDSKLEQAKLFGATDVVNTTNTTLTEAIGALSEGGVDHVFEAVGLKQTIEDAWGALRPGGTVTVIGVVDPNLRIELPARSLVQEKRLVGSLMGSNRFRIDVPLYAELYLAGRIRLDELVGDVTDLSGIEDAFAAMASGEALRTVVEFA